MALELDDFTGQIIGAAIEVHRELGSGLLESVYEAALVVEFRHRPSPSSASSPCPSSTTASTSACIAKPTLEMKRVLARQPIP